MESIGETVLLEMNSQNEDMENKEEEEVKEEPQNDVAREAKESVGFCPTDRRWFQGHPPQTRSETKQIVETWLHDKDPIDHDAYGEGPMILSDIPQSILEQSQRQQQETNNGNGLGVVLGIDEAGRGSVLGPMIYGVAYWLTSNNEESQRSKSSQFSVFADSKQLTPERRQYLWDHVLLHEQSTSSNTKSDNKRNEIGFGARILTAMEISRNMHRTPTPFNLNQMSHAAAMQLIRQVRQQLPPNVPLVHCYIDTVGNPHHYQRQLQQTFPGIDFTVEAKADANYPPCQAASIVAKVLRDAKIHQDSILHGHSMGSGYPSDPNCRAWIQAQCGQCPVFGFDASASKYVRFSWNPIQQLFATKQPHDKESTNTGTRSCAASITFAADDEDDEGDNHQNQRSTMKQQRQAMQSFVGTSTTRRKAPRYPYFAKKRLRAVTHL